MDSRKTEYAKRVIVAIVIFAIIIAICLTSNQVGQYELTAGDISTVDIYAPRTIIDKTTTKAQREAAMKSVQPVYKLDNNLKVAAIDRLNEFFASVTTIRSGEDSESAASQIEAVTKITLEKTLYINLASMNDIAFRRLQGITDCVDEIMTQGVSNKEDGMAAFAAAVEKLNLGDSLNQIAVALADAVITENLTVDETETQKQRDAAAAAIEPIEYKKNQTLVRRGEIVTQAQLDMMSELGMLKGSSSLSMRYVVGVTTLLLLCFGLIGAYIFFCDRRQNRYINRFVIIGIVAVSAVAMSFYVGRNLSDLTRCLLPMGIVAAIVAIFADVRIALMVNLCVSLICAVGVQHDWSYGICLIIGGSITAFCFGCVKRRVNIIPASLISAFGNGITFACMALLETEDTRGILMSFAMGLLGGFISGVATAGTLPFWEWGFDVLTPMKLYELSNPESKLLKKLLIQAPGTYHHSLTVANLAEISARAIGADSVLARVGAYYHDIGKMNHPLYFKENQYTENPHDNMTYADSARVIINHVSDGLAIAAQYHLPRGIRDIIAQHHGTTNTGYFYKRALQEDPGCDTSVFSYKGPRPQTRESAIIMLCDSCEAAVRSLSSKDEAEIDKMVRGLIKARMEDGQLNDSALTFGELEIVTNTIIKTLGGYFHERIQY